MIADITLKVLFSFHTWSLKKSLMQKKVKLDNKNWTCSPDVPTLWIT